MTRWSDPTRAFLLFGSISITRAFPKANLLKWRLREIAPEKRGCTDREPFSGSSVEGGETLTQGRALGSHVCTRNGTLSCDVSPADCAYVGSMGISFPFSCLSIYFSDGFKTKERSVLDTPCGFE